MNEPKQEVEAQEVEQTPKDSGAPAAPSAAAKPSSGTDKAEGTKKTGGPLEISLPFPMSTGAIRGAALLAVVGGLSSASFGFTQLRPVYNVMPVLEELPPDRPAFEMLLIPGSSDPAPEVADVQAIAPVTAPTAAVADAAAPVAPAPAATPPPPAVAQAAPQSVAPTPPPQVAKAPVSTAPTGLDSPDAATRKKAVRRLRRSGLIDAATTTSLLAMLSDSDSGVRESVVTALASASAKTPQITAGLVRATKDSSETVRVRAVTSLGSAPGSDEVITALRSALRDRSTSVRNNAILTLGKHGSRSSAAASELVTILKTNSNVYSRSFAGTALGQIGSPTENVVAALVLAMGDGSQTVRAAAKHSLTLLGDPAVSALSRQMAGGSAGVREVLQTIGTPGALAVLGGK